MATSQKCGVFLCRFQDTLNDPTPPVSFFRRLFLRRGNQSLNDYWADVSLNSIDLEGTEIHDWVTIPMTVAQFRERYPSRYDKIHGGASFFGVDLSQYKMIITVTNGNMQDAGSHGGVLANFDVMNNHTFLAHEMGHEFGLGHSFDTSDRKAAEWSAPGEYFDRYDIMSAMNVWGQSHPEFTSTGPLLCAYFVDNKDWMPASRKWIMPNLGKRSFCERLTLTALGHREQRGYLMAQVGDYTIEFRTKDSWDSGIPRHGILIHHISEGRPYIIASDMEAGIQDWQPSQFWNSNPFHKYYGSNISVQVESFDLENLTATIKVCYSPGTRRLFDEAIGGQIIGAVAVDGGGFIIINGKIIKIPPRSPFVEIADIVSNLKIHTEDTVDKSAQLENIEKLEKLLAKLKGKKK